MAQTLPGLSPKCLTQVNRTWKNMKACSLLIFVICGSANGDVLPQDEIKQCVSTTCSSKDNPGDELAFLQRNMDQGHQQPLSMRKRYRRHRLRTRRGNGYKYGDYSYYRPTASPSTTTSSTSSATEATEAPPAVPTFVLGDLHDTCNDFCQFNEFAGCNLTQIQSIDTEEELAITVQQIAADEGANFTCLTNNSIFNQGVYYEPRREICSLSRNGVNCDHNTREEVRPLCFCTGTTSTTTPSAAWTLGPRGSSCDSVCQAEGKVCDPGPMEEIDRIPRAIRLFEALNIPCLSGRGRFSRAPTYLRGVNVVRQECAYNKNPTNCSLNVDDSLEPLCYCV